MDARCDEKTFGTYCYCSKLLLARSLACFRLVARENVKSEGGWEKRGRLFKSQAHPYRIRRYLEKVMEKVCVSHYVQS
jgi:hypothetical protein